jgi:hypothetical protein
MEDGALGLRWDYTAGEANNTDWEVESFVTIERGDKPRAERALGTLRVRAQLPNPVSAELVRRGCMVQITDWPEGIGGDEVLSSAEKDAVAAGTAFMKWRLKSCLTNEVTGYTEPIKIGKRKERSEEPYAYLWLPLHRRALYSLPAVNCYSAPLSVQIGVLAPFCLDGLGDLGSQVFVWCGSCNTRPLYIAVHRMHATTAQKRIVLYYKVPHWVVAEHKEQADVLAKIPSNSDTPPEGKWTLTGVRSAQLKPSVRFLI